MGDRNLSNRHDKVTKVGRVGIGLCRNLTLLIVSGQLVKGGATRTGVMFHRSKGCALKYARSCSHFDQSCFIRCRKHCRKGNIDHRNARWKQCLPKQSKFASVSSTILTKSNNLGSLEILLWCIGSTHGNLTKIEWEKKSVRSNSILLLQGPSFHQHFEPASSIKRSSSRWSLSCATTPLEMPIESLVHDRHNNCLTSNRPPVSITVHGIENWENIGCTLASIAGE